MVPHLTQLQVFFGVFFVNSMEYSVVISIASCTSVSGLEVTLSDLDAGYDSQALQM